MVEQWHRVTAFNIYKLAGGKLNDPDKYWPIESPEKDNDEKVQPVISKELYDEIMNRHTINKRT